MVLRLLGATVACVLLLASAPAVGDDGHVTVAFAAEPTQLDPTRSSAGVDLYFIDLFYEQLLRLDRSLERRNWLAESWEITERDGKKLIFVKLREGVRFHNGDELTAHDLRYAYER